MSQSRRFLIRMVLFLVLVAGLAALLGRPLVNAFMGNPAVNGVILGILISGIVYIFRQVLSLDPEIRWIEEFRNHETGGSDSAGAAAPRLLGSMARMLGAQQGRRVSLSATSVPAYIQALLEQTADSLENLQRIIARGEESRIGANATLASLTDRLGVLGEQMKAGQILMVRLAENQLELRPSLARLAEAVENSLGHDDVLRNHLRNIEAYVARLSEDVVQGREQSVQDLRGDIRIFARTIAALAEDARR